MNISFWDADNRLICERAIAEDPSVDFNFLRADADLLRSAGLKLTMRFHLPILDIQGIWTSQHGSGKNCPKLKLPWSFESTSSQQSDVPYVAFFRINQKNSASIALTCIHDDVRIKGQMDQMRRVYQMEITVAIMPETEPFDLMMSFSEKRWNLLLESWRTILFPDGKPLFSDDAFEPVYCTWYAAHAALTNEYLDRNARLAAELGFRTFIVDDGWSYPEMKRVCPEKMGEGWYRDIGNWTVSEEKLPAFKKHVEYAQSLGLKYLLWTSPFFAGVCSEEFKKASLDKEKEIALQEWGDVAILDPDGSCAAHAIDLLKNLMTDLALDGVKIDFLDYIPKSVDKPRSRACLHYFQKLAAAIRSVNPNALMEFRQSYATPQMLEFGTQFRAGDVPFDFVENLQRLAEIRTIVGDKVPCHADPIYFHQDEKPENVAHHIIAALAGVPMLSMELSELTPAQNEIISFWLNFYKKHFETFKNGHWDIVFFHETPSYLTVESETEVIAIVINPDKVPGLSEQFGKKTFYALNLSGDLLDLPGASAFTCAGKPIGGTTAPAGGYLQR